MQCRICREPAGWLRRTCRLCACLLGTWQERRGAGMGELLECFLATGATPEKVEAFLAHPCGPGGVTVRDQIAADMTNQLLEAMGRPASQHGDTVRRLREKGAWRAYDRRPQDVSKL